MQELSATEPPNTRLRSERNCLSTESWSSAWTSLPLVRRNSLNTCLHDLEINDSLLFVSNQALRALGCPTPDDVSNLSRHLLLASALSKMRKSAASSPSSSFSTTMDILCGGSLFFMDVNPHMHLIQLCDISPQKEHSVLA
ncbi:hypothetical protein NQZ68_002607 [Dissostichus eleginoides]|nr:hypothetical protein NQZ68_002607 [Dissostichus eleginoides]